MQVEIASVSTKGQVVIPKDIRRQLGIEVGSKLMVVTDGQNVLMKPVATPQLEAFRELAEESRLAAENAGIAPVDVERTVSEVRNAHRR